MMEFTANSLAFESLELLGLIYLMQTSSKAIHISTFDQQSVSPTLIDTKEYQDRNRTKNAVDELHARGESMRNSYDNSAG